MQPAPVSARATRAVLGLGLVALSLTGCTIRAFTTTDRLTINAHEGAMPEDWTREWTVRDSAGQQHKMRLVQEAVVPGLRRITLQDNGRTLFTMNEWWVKGLTGWHLDSRELVKHSPTGDSLSWTVTPGGGFLGSLRPEGGGGTTGYRVLAAPGDEANGEGCGAKSLNFLASSLKLHAALIALATEPDATSYFDARSAVTTVGAAFDIYSRCLAKLASGA